ncbi:enoyl-CoA hydratase [[Pasteurella] aerogenes]|nr:enoyl-CoA hydratase [[Pasteurella] aerogenes]
MGKIYLALYKGNAKNWRERLEDWLIRKVTRGQYSHCEIVIEKTEFTGASHYDIETSYTAYSSSPRDGGVRCKQINVNNGNWDLIPLPSVTESQVRSYFERTKGRKYDWCGVLGLVFGLKQNRKKFFCSEWCFNVIFNSEQGWRFSPNDLAIMIKENCFAKNI